MVITTSFTVAGVYDMEMEVWWWKRFVNKWKEDKSKGNKDGTEPNRQCLYAGCVWWVIVFACGMLWLCVSGSFCVWLCVGGTVYPSTTVHSEREHFVGTEITEFRFSDSTRSAPREGPNGDSS
jgi:hypothetical protein